MAFQCEICTAFSLSGWRAALSGLTARTNFFHVSFNVSLSGGLPASAIVTLVGYSLSFLYPFARLLICSTTAKHDRTCHYQKG